MIKKFFISLIILLALTSEGLADLPGHFYGLTLGLANSSGLKSGQQVSDRGPERKNAGSDIKCSSIAGKYTRFSVLNLDYAKCRVCDNPAYKGCNNYFHVTSVLPGTGFSRTASRDIIINESDSSPPQHILV